MMGVFRLPSRAGDVEMGSGGWDTCTHTWLWTPTSFSFHMCDLHHLALSTSHWTVLSSVAAPA